MRLRFFGWLISRRAHSAIFPLWFLFLLAAWPLPLQARDHYQQAFDWADKKQWYAALEAAYATRNTPVIDYIEWRRLKDPLARPTLEEALGFLKRHRDWPDCDILWWRAAEVWALEGAPLNAFKDLQALHTGIHGGKTPAFTTPEALLAMLWEKGEFLGVEQEALLQRYRPLLRTQTALKRRTDELLWQGKIAPARSLIPKLASGERKLAEARIALMTSAKGVERSIAAVPSALRSDPALLYERMRWRARKGLDSGVRELLNAAPAKVPHPEKWWRYRAIQARDAIEDGKYQEALRLLNKHGQERGAEYADALWLRGWLLLEFLNRPKEAYQDFYKLYHAVSYPVSLSRGAYWAGKAAQLNGNPKIAANWFREAAKHPATFYGQLALLDLGVKRIPLTGSSGGRGSAGAGHLPGSMVSLINILARYKQNASVEKFLLHLARHYRDPSMALAAGELAQKLGYPHYAIRVGKTAAQSHHFTLAELSHPLISVASGMAIEPALTLAITRQESEFDPSARSSAGALGLMQIMPATARHMAKKYGLASPDGRLTNPAYNMQLGSLYLGHLIDVYDGRYPLAIAAYNAGPGNVRKWIQRFGQPPRDMRGTLRWLERIPFPETRNYVQRVLENLQVYRQRLDGKETLEPQKIFGRG